MKTRILQNRRRYLDGLTIALALAVLILAPSASAVDCSYPVVIGDSLVGDILYGSEPISVSMQPSNELVTIVPTSGKTTIIADCINDTFPPYSITGTASVVYHLNEGYTIDEAIAELKDNDAVDLVIPVVINNDDGITKEAYATEQVVLTASYPWTVAGVISNLENNYYCQVIEQDGGFGFEIDGVWRTLPENEGTTRLLIRMTKQTRTLAGIDDPFALSRELHSQPGISSISPNFAARLNQASISLESELSDPPQGSPSESDPYRGFQWYLENSTDVDVDFDSAHALVGNNGSSHRVIIAVIGEGFYLDHPDLDPGSVYATYNATGIPSWNDVSPPEDIPQVDWPDWSYSTQVAGILAAQEFNGEGIQGMAPWAQYIYIRVANDERFSDTWSIWRALQLTALLSAYDGCDVVVFPHFTTASSALTDALALNHKYNNVIVAPLGDKGGPLPFPGCSPYTVAITGYNEFNVVEGYTSNNPLPDGCAPGTDIFTVDAPGELGSNPKVAYCTGDQDYFCRLHGPGAASGIVSGIIGQMFSVAPNMKKVYSEPHTMRPLNWVRQVLRRSTSDYDGGAYPLYGFGSINASRALAMAAAGDVDASTAVDIDDVVYLIGYIFTGGDAPQPYAFTGDSNCSGGVDIDDVVYLIAYIFTSGPEPVRTCSDRMPPL
ncbi:MAG: S8 family serine peptidase [Candidatus Zixiibacteriota bacterium]